MSPTPRRCVYTSLIGEYEQLNEQPVASESAIPFICLTDSTSLQSRTWQVRVVRPAFPMDPVRSQRDLKLRPHVHLPDFDQSLYIDNSILLSEPPEKIFESCFRNAGFSLLYHDHRETLLDEFIEVARRGLDDPARIFEQLNHYLLQDPDLLAEKPYWGGFLLRDHADAAVRSMSEIWLAHVFRYARRDQLSINVAFRQSGLVPEAWRLSNYRSWFHSWPHTPTRDHGKREHSFASYSPPIARLRIFEQSVAEREKSHSAALEASEQARRDLERALAEKETGHAAALEASEQARRGLEQALAEREKRHSAALEAWERDEARLRAQLDLELSAAKEEIRRTRAERIRLAVQMATARSGKSLPSPRSWPRIGGRGRARQRALKHERLRLLVLVSGLFDAAWYAEQYPDVAGMNLLDHYLAHGGREGRSPGPDFDAAWYLRRYPDVARAGLNPLVHYLLHGVEEGRQPRPPG